jgi:hypothetical protein
MINSTQKWWGAAAIALLCFVPSAFANSGSLTLTGAGNNVMNNVYVGPYYATVNGAANTAVICDDFADDSVVGHSWNFNTNNFSTLGTALWGNQTKNYEAAAWLTVQMLSLNGNPSNNTQVGYLSFAIWSLFDKSALAGLTSVQLAGVNAWLAKVPGNLTLAMFSNFVILTPQGCTPGSCPGQEFLEMTMPDGGSSVMYLLLAGMACFGAIFFRGRQSARIVSDAV